MTVSTVELDGILIGFSKDNYSDLSFDVTQACFLLGISRERYRSAMKDAKEIYSRMGDATETCDPLSKEWICYEHLKRLAVWLSVRGNRVAREFYYLMKHVPLIDVFKSLLLDPESKQVASDFEQWSIHFDWVTRIGFVLDIALDPFTASEEVVLPYISIDPIVWRISERIAEYGFRASYPTIRQINFNFMAQCVDKLSIIHPLENPQDIEIGFEHLPLLDECIREVVNLGNQ